MDCNWWKIVEKQEEILVFLPLGTRRLGHEVEFSVLLSVPEVIP